jgi:hypothetical protein
MPGRDVYKLVEDLRRKHGKDRSLVRKFPDLKFQEHAKLSNGFGKSTPKKAPMPQSHGLLVGTPHKQGPMVVSREELPWAGGKKPN